MGKSYTSQQEQQVIDLKESGLKGKDVAHIVFNDKSKRSTVNRIYARHLDTKDEVEPVKFLASIAKSSRTAQRTNTQLRKQNRDIIDSYNAAELVVEGIKKAVDEINNTNVFPAEQVAKGSRTSLTAEVLFSDWQCGKLMKGYDSKVAVKRVEEYASVICKEIEKKINNGYHFDKILLSFLGDIIESDEKHANSARGCDSSTAEQMSTAIVCLTGFIEKLAMLGIPMDVVCITGNHDWNGHGLNSYRAGATQLSNPLYVALREIISAKGYDKVEFVIPEGCFYVTDIYGFKVLYEHGCGVKVSEKGLSDRKAQRSSQIGEYITYFRMGDKHNISRFNEDTDIVNGAFFGGDDEGTEYSSMLGYHSDPAQLVIFHTPRTDGRKSVYDSLVVQLKHIK